MVRIPSFHCIAWVQSLVGELRAWQATQHNQNKKKEGKMKERKKMFIRKLTQEELPWWSRD